MDQKKSSHFKWPLWSFVIPSPAFCGTCWRGGVMGPYHGAHEGCICGAESPHGNRRERKAWRKAHREQAEHQAQFTEYRERYDDDEYY